VPQAGSYRQGSVQSVSERKGIYSLDKQILAFHQGLYSMEIHCVFVLVIMKTKP
jgi:hypothetical protein